MKLDLDPFPVAMINFEEKRVLVQTDQAESTKGKKVLISVKPRSPEPRVWKKNERRKTWLEWRLTSSFLIDKYTRGRCESVFSRLRGQKWGRSLQYDRVEKFIQEPMCEGISRRNGGAGKGKW
jgi:hypothetical protein